MDASLCRQDVARGFCQVDIWDTIQWIYTEWSWPTVTVTVTAGAGPPMSCSASLEVIRDPAAVSRVTVTRWSCNRPILRPSRQISHDRPSDTIRAMVSQGTPGQAASARSLPSMRWSRYESTASIGELRAIMVVTRHMASNQSLSTSDLFSLINPADWGTHHTVWKISPLSPFGIGTATIMIRSRFVIRSQSLVCVSNKFQYTKYNVSPTLLLADSDSDSVY